MDVLSFPTTFTITALAVTFAAACVLKFVFNWSGNKGKYHPVAGTAIDHLLNFNRLHDYMTEMATKYKTYRVLHLSRSEVYTSDPANVEYILKTNFPNYGKGWHHYGILNDLLGDGIFTVDGEKWRSQRKISSYEFSTKNLRDFSSAVFRTSAVKLAQKVSEAVTSNKATEIQDLFTKSTLETVFKILLGVDLDTTTEEGILFSSSFDEANAVTFYRYVDVFWKVKRSLNIGSEANMKKCIKVVDEFVYKIIRNKTEQTSKLRDDSRVDGKLCLSDDTLPDGFRIRKGDAIAYQPWAMGRMKSLWGDDAEDFRPERWFDENGCFRQESPFKFTAFQVGPRICLGKQFAYRQMKIFSAVLLGTFRFKLSDEERGVKYRTKLTLHIDGGLHLYASYRL